jgi:hypothetical protein
LGGIIKILQGDAAGAIESVAAVLAVCEQVAPPTINLEEIDDDVPGAGAIARAQVVMERQKLVDTYLSWGERYATSLLQLEEEAEEARNGLEDRLRKLGYVDLG